MADNICCHNSYYAEPFGPPPPPPPLATPPLPGVVAPLPRAAAVLTPPRALSQATTRHWRRARSSTNWIPPSSRPFTTRSVASRSSALRSAAHSVRLYYPAVRFPPGGAAVMRVETRARRWRHPVFDDLRWWLPCTITGAGLPAL